MFLSYTVVQDLGAIVVIVVFVCRVLRPLPLEQTFLSLNVDHYHPIYTRCTMPFLLLFSLFPLLRLLPLTLVDAIAVRLLLPCFADAY